MSAPTMSTAGCARRRAKAVARRENVRRIAEWIEDVAFYDHGTFPESATAFSICSCGARAFARGEHPDLSDFHDAHAYCDEGGAS